MPSRDDGLFPCFRRQLSVTSRRGAVLAGLLFLPSACDDAIVAHDPVAPLGDAGVTPSPDAPTEGLGDAGTGLPHEPTEAPQSVGIARVPDVASGGSPDSDMLALGVLERLDAMCGACHSNGESGAGFSHGLELARLIESGLIVPGSSATSPLMARIVDGTMPPEAARAQYPQIGSPTVGDVALIADFIDQLAGGPLPSCEPLPFFGLDAVYAALLADVQSRPPEEHRVLRYVSLTDASNARLCGPALDQQRQALFKLVNSLSMQSEIHVPIAVDPAALLYRIDLRHYGWDRDIDLDGDGTTDHRDGWEAALSVMPGGVAFDGPEAGALSAETDALVPLSRLSALTRAAADGEVYRALLGVAPNVYDMQLSFGLDAVVELLDGTARRAGFRRYPPYESQAMATRLPLGDLGRAFWWLDADEEPSNSSSIYEDPLGFVGGPWLQTIWELPNGLHGYLLNGSDGAALSTTSDCGGTCVRPEQRHAVGCMGCHAGGLRPMQDSIRAYTERYRTSFDSETFGDILTIYPPAAELDQIIATDNDRYRAALERAGLQPGAPDPISRVYLDFDRPLDLERAAAELGVPAQTLTDHLGALPALAPLGNASGSIERSVFEAAHLEALCTVHATSRNRPTSCP